MTSKQHIYMSIIVSLMINNGCTVWQYDLESCDPAKGINACSRLNERSGVNVSEYNALSCNEIWLCDKVTGSCKQGIRDTDGDGESPTACRAFDADCAAGLATCRATDCDDSQSVLNSANSSCSCAQLVNQPCDNDLVGACFAQGTWQCDPARMPFCKATEEMSSSWDNVKSTVAKSWDRNCNGTIDKICTNDKNKELDCVIHCNDKARAAYLQPGATAKTICDEYCSAANCLDQKETGSSFFLNCISDGKTVSPEMADMECGMRMVKCRCGFNLRAECRQNGFYAGEPDGYVYCR